MRRPTLFLALAAIVASVAMTATRDARADDAGHVHASLDYVVPDGVAGSGCPDRDAFASSVSTRLGYDPFAGDAAAGAVDAPSSAHPKTLVVRFRREKKAVSALLRIDDTEKSIVSETGACDELGAAAAFAAAIMIDPRVMFPRPAAPPGAPPPASGASLDSNAPGTWPWYEPPPTLPPDAPKPAPEGKPLLLRAGVAGAACAGCSPAPNVGIEIFAGLARDRFGVDLGARADLAASADSSVAGRTVSSSLVIGEVFPHARLGPARLGLLGQVGALFGESGDDKQTSVWAGAGARLGLAIPLVSPVFLHVALDGVAVIGRVSLRVAGREVWSSPGFAGGLSLGGGVEF